MPHKDPERLREYKKAYNERRKDEKRKYNTAYREANKERLSEAQAKYREANKEKISAYLKAWRANNQEKTRQYSKVKTQRIVERWHNDEEYRQSKVEYARAWRAANTDRCRAAELRWRSKNPDKVVAKMQRHRLNAPSSQPEYQRLKYRTDPDYRAKKILKVSNRTARKKGGGGTYDQGDIKRIWDRQKHQCAVPGCKSPIAESGPNKYHIDHIQALVNGGSNWPDNLQLLCRRHNLTKHAKDEYEWAQSHGMLFPR